MLLTLILVAFGIILTFGGIAAIIAAVSWRNSGGKWTSGMIWLLVAGIIGLVLGIILFAAVYFVEQREQRPVVLTPEQQARLATYKMELQRRRP